MPTIQVSEDVEATPELLRRVEGRYFLPGETVRRRVPGASACATVSYTEGADLVVASTRVLGTGDGGLRVAYVFEGIGGVHDAEQFGDPRSSVHHFAVLIQRQGLAWLVPLDDRSDPVVQNGGALRLTERLSRSARYALGIEDGEQSGGVFFAGLETAPVVGEFGVLLNEDGSADLDYSPWTSGVSAVEIGIAEEAITEAGFVSAPASIN